MSYFHIPDFKFGMDRRRKRVSGVSGTLWGAKNAHITRGGDVERAKKFVSKYALPPSTFGLFRIRRQLYVVGSNSNPGMPNGVQYQQLTNPNGFTMTRVLDWGVFAQKLYIIAEFADGNIYHYYNGSRVTDWDTIAAGNSDLTTLAAYLESKINGSSDVTALSSGVTILITARTSGTPFTLATGVVNRGADNSQAINVFTIQANVVEVPEVRAHGTITITAGTSDPGVNKVSNITVNGVSLMLTPVNWVLSNSATASAVAVEINNRTASHQYTAIAAGNVITITAAPGTGATVNGQAIATTLGGNVGASTSGTVSGGVTHVAPVAQIVSANLAGSYEAGDEFTITINGVAYTATGRASGTGINVFVNKNRVWSVAGTLLVGSKLNTPSNFSDATASTGFIAIDVSTASGSNERLVGMAAYQTFVAVFSPVDVLLYQFSTDATQVSLVQPLTNTGCRATRGVLGYGSNDVYYLDLTGIRSLRPRDMVNAAFVADVGTPIDVFVRDQIKTIPLDTVSRAVAAIEPLDGRFWLSIGARIYVLSFFPSSKIDAWTYYEPPAPITDIVRIGEQIYARGGNTIYLYGGDSGDVYPDDNEQVVVIDLPFLSAEKPANEKRVGGYDNTLDNEWLVEALLDPNDEAKVETIGRLNRSTYNLPDVGAAFRTSAVALRLTCSRAGPATLSSLTIHFNSEAAE